MEGDELTFEPVRAEVAGKTAIVRKPYHERYYLLYGGTEGPAQIDVGGTHAFLEGLGFGKRELSCV